MLGVAQSTVRAWSDAGRLPVFYTPGGHRRFKRDDLDGFLSRNGAGSRPRNAATVLVVDDDPRLRELIRVNLEYDGMTVIEAGTAEEGLRALEADPPDLVMLDVMMPGIDGWEMLRRVRERHGIDSLPVMMFSGKTEGGNGEGAGRGRERVRRQAARSDRAGGAGEGHAPRPRHDGLSAAGGAGGQRVVRHVTVPRVFVRRPF